MKNFRARRWLLSLVTLAAGLALVAAWWLGRAALRPVDLYSGVLLLAVLLALTFFNARKKLPFLPLLNASAWLQFHIYAGWLSVLLFALHTETKLPRGPLGLALWLVFLLLAASGAFGLWLSRWLPPRLARSGESLVYERIPRLRRQLEDEAAALVEQARVETGSGTLADFHRQVLAPYFAYLPPVFAPLAGDEAAHHRARHELAALRRFLNEREMTIADQLDELMEAKRNLEVQLGGQRLLRLWLFVHIPLTYGLLVLVGAHVWLVVHFSHRL